MYDAVGIEVEGRRFSAHSAQKAATASMPSQRRQCGSTGSPHTHHRRQQFAVCPEPVGHQLIRERRQASLRHERRIEVAHRTGSGIARIRKDGVSGTVSRSALVRIE